LRYILEAQHREDHPDRSGEDPQRGDGGNAPQGDPLRDTDWEGDDQVWQNHITDQHDGWQQEQDESQGAEPQNIGKDPEKELPGQIAGCLRHDTPPFLGRMFEKAAATNIRRIKMDRGVFIVRC